MQNIMIYNIVAHHVTQQVILESTLYPPRQKIETTSQNMEAHSLGTTHRRATPKWDVASSLVAISGTPYLYLNMNSHTKL